MQVSTHRLQGDKRGLSQGLAHAWLRRLTSGCTPPSFTLGWAGGLGAGLLLGLGGGDRAYAAEQITFMYPPFGDFAIELQDLETFAAQGKITPNFSPYARRATPQQLGLLRDLLQRRFEIPATLVGQFTYSPLGQSVVKRLAQVVQTEDRREGFYELRSALILAAADKQQGLTVVNVLRKFPGKSLRVNANALKQTVENLAELFQTRDRRVAQIQQQSLKEAAQQPLSSPLQDLTPPGPQPWLKRTLQFNYQPPDNTERRRFAVDLYLPQRSPNSPVPSLSAPSPLAPQPQPSLPGAPLAHQPPAMPDLGPNQLAQRVPTLVFSHGVAENRETYTYLAEYLASHGFAVITLDHPGGDSQRIARYLSGLAAPPAAAELINRPRDVKFVLDQLTRYQADPQALEREGQTPATADQTTQLPNAQHRAPRLLGHQSRGAHQRDNNINISSLELRDLDLTRIGILGHSFGGYTALALAGAPIDLDQVKQDCNPNQSLNVSVFLQCRANELLPPNAPQATDPATLAATADPRIQAVLAINPLISTVLGRRSLAKITVPVMLMAAGDDILTPAVPEQIIPFGWLTTRYKYLVLMERATHFSVEVPPRPGDQVLPVPLEMLGTNQAIAHRYLQALSLAFFQTHLAQSPSYSPYLRAAYAQTISQTAMPLSLIQTPLP